MNKEYNNYASKLIKAHKSKARAWAKMRILFLFISFSCFFAGVGNIYIIDKTIVKKTDALLKQKNDKDNVTYTEMQLYVQKEKMESCYVYLIWFILIGIALFLYVLADWNQYRTRHLMKAQMLEYYLNQEEKIEQTAGD